MLRGNRSVLLSTTPYGNLQKLTQFYLSKRFPSKFDRDFSLKDSIYYKACLKYVQYRIHEINFDIKRFLVQQNNKLLEQFSLEEIATCQRIFCQDYVSHNPDDKFYVCTEILFEIKAKMKLLRDHLILKFGKFLKLIRKTIQFSNRSSRKEIPTTHNSHDIIKQKNIIFQLHDNLYFTINHDILEFTTFSLCLKPFLSFLPFDKCILTCSQGLFMSTISRVKGKSLETPTLSQKELRVRKIYCLKNIKET